MAKSKQQEISEQDVMFLDYHEPCIRIIPADEFENYLQTEDLSVIKSVRQSLIDHVDRQKDDIIYVFNGYTALLVRDFIRDPIQASRGKDNPVIDLSIELFNTYDEYEGLIEVLHIHTGEIFKYLDLESALETHNHSLYDLIKLNIDEVLESTSETYCFPVVDQKWVYRPVNHSVEWKQYAEFALSGNL